MPGHRTLNPQTSLPGELPNPGPDDDYKHFYYYISIHVSSCGVVILTCLILYIYLIFTLIKKSRLKKETRLNQTNEPFSSLEVPLCLSESQSSRRLCQGTLNLWGSESSILWRCLLLVVLRRWKRLQKQQQRNQMEGRRKRRRLQSLQSLLLQTQTWWRNKMAWGTGKKLLGEILM